MKKNQKALLSFTLAALVFSAGCAFFSDNPLLTFIDVLSILSLVLLVGGLVEFLIHGGYFDFMTYSFSSAKNLLTRHPEAQPQRYFDYARDNDVMNTHISNLRKKLGDEGWRIETIWGLGYRFIKD